jgi:UDP-3-O-[3-hydroxymyristoyl] glucosamine N-acyltransferase
MTDTCLTTGQVARLVDAELIGRDDLLIERPGVLESAGPGDICFIRSPEYAHRWAESRGTAALVSRGIAVPGHDPVTRALLVVRDADHALIRLLEHFTMVQTAQVGGIHPSAVVDADATVAKSAVIGPLCVVGARTQVGEGARLVAHVSLGEGVVVGARCVLHPGTVVYDRCVIGEETVLHGNVVIGGDGFGYRPSLDGRGLTKIPHIGNVVLGARVEIGASSCVDRAKFGSTTIGEGTKIDNLVQIAHNSHVGKHCVICGHTGIAGSVTIGDGVQIGGKVGIPDNISVGSGASIGGGSMVLNDVPAGATWIGSPAAPAREALASLAVFRRLPELARMVRALNKSQQDRVQKP